MVVETLIIIYIYAHTSMLLSRLVSGHEFLFVRMSYVIYSIASTADPWNLLATNYT